MIISIEGNIGSGKSSCIDALCTYEDVLCASHDGALGPVLSEPLHRWKAWLPDLYSGKPVHLTVQVAVLVAYRDLIQGLSPDQRTIVERCPSTSIEVFAKEAYAEGWLDERAISLLTDLHRCIGWAPEAMVYIRTSPSVCMQRLRQRDRTGEEGITFDLLCRLHDLHEQMFANFPGPKVAVDGDRSLHDVSFSVSNWCHAFQRC